MAAKDFWFGKGSGFVQAPSPYNQGQQSALDQILSLGLGQVQNPQAGFEPIAQQARQQFNQTTVPSIMERFTSLGGGGGRSSSLAQILGSQAAGLESNLASLGAQFGQRQQQLGQGLLGMGLVPTQDFVYQQREPGFLENLGFGLLDAAGNAAGGFFGGGGLSSILNFFKPQSSGGGQQQQGQQPGNMQGQINPQAISALAALLSGRGA